MSGMYFPALVVAALQHDRLRMIGDRMVQRLGPRRDPARSAVIQCFATNSLANPCTVFCYVSVATTSESSPLWIDSSDRIPFHLAGHIAILDLVDRRIAGDADHPHLRLAVLVRADLHAVRPGEIGHAPMKDSHCYLRVAGRFHARNGKNIFRPTFTVARRGVSARALAR